MLHQLHALTEIPIEAPPEGGGSSPYSGGGACDPSIAVPTLTILQGNTAETFPLPGTPLAVDLALSPDGYRAALAMPGDDSGQMSLAEVSLSQPASGHEELDCGPAPIFAEGQFTAVAYTSSNDVVAQSREPALLLVRTGYTADDEYVIELEGESRFDTGHEIFHRTTDSGLSCASCHPEGGDDGHVWSFDGLGARRTQPLDVGLAGTAPFHWGGDMTDLDMLMNEVLSFRMGGKRQSEDRQESFKRWLFEQRRPPADAALDDEALVQDGEALFAAYRCTSCHQGEGLGGTMAASINGQELQVPILRRVSLRPPFMHDGRSKTLHEATLDMIVSTIRADPPPYDVEAITAYLRTL